MKKIISLLLFMSISCFAAPPDQVDQLAADSREFSLHLFSSLSNTDNLVVSPYSLFSALSMVYVGARGETASQMQKTLSLNFSSLKLPSVYEQLSRMLSPEKTDKISYQLNMANGLWLTQDTFLLSDFRHAMEAEFDAKIQTLDFNQAEEAIQIINEWTANQTDDKIQALLQKGDVDSSTRLILTNAVAFQGAWRRPFDAKLTAPSDFFSTPKQAVTASMMHQTSLFPYAENDLAQCLALPFQGKSAAGGDLLCLIFLPKTDVGLQEVEKSITAAELKAWIEKLKTEQVKVDLPSFQMKSRFDLNSTLIAMGMGTSFSQKADFSGVDGMKDLFLSKVIHEAFFALDEKGVVAAAATSASLNVTSTFESKSPTVFNANHPFLFLIVDSFTKTALFLGKFVCP